MKRGRETAIFQLIQYTPVFIHALQKSLLEHFEVRVLEIDERDRRVALFNCSLPDHPVIFLEQQKNRHFRCVVAGLPESSLQPLKGFFKSIKTFDALPKGEYDKAIMFYHPSAKQDLKKIFSRIRAKKKYIINHDGLMYKGDLISRFCRKLLSIQSRKLEKLAQQSIGKIIDQNICWPENSSSLKTTREILKFPYRVVQSANLNSVHRLAVNRLIEKPELYDESYHDRKYLAQRKDWPQLLVNYQNNRMCYLESAGCLRVIQPSRKVLDIGCGTGCLIGLLLQHGMTAFGTDISSHALEIANRNFPDAFFFVSNAHELPVTTTFDLITLSHSLEHFPKPLQLLKDIRNLLSDDGMLFIEVPLFSKKAFASRPKWMWQQDHFTEFSATGLRKSLRLAGYRIVKYGDGYSAGTGEPYQFISAVRK